MCKWWSLLELRDVLTVMVHLLHHPYVQIILNQENSQAAPITMKPSLHHPYVQMVVLLELRDVLTVMVHSLHHPYVQIILNQEI